ncbi:apolipoprotein N-acyltransferase [bacterium]|nr:apolipoprotein N-acyltransferase [bacterium]
MLILRALLAACLLAVAFPTLSLWPLSFVAIALLIVKLVDLQETPRRMALFFGTFAVGCNFVGFYWLAYTIHEFAEFSWFLSIPIAVLLFFALGLISAGFGFVWQLLQLKFKNRSIYFRLLLLLLFFVLWDYQDIRLFPWSPMMALASNDYLLASVGVFDSLAWRFLFFALSALTFVVLFSRERQKARIVSSFLFLSLLGGAMMVGRSHRDSLKKEYSQRQPVALLQGNIGNYEKRQTDAGVEPTVRNVLSIYRNLIEEAATTYAEIATGNDALEPWYVWPETSFPGFPLRDRHMQDQLDFWVNMSRGLHLVGAYEDGTMMFNGKEKATEYNIALLLHEDVGYVDHYRKIALMPYGEYFPGDFLVPQVYEWVPQVNHFGRGEGPKLLAHPDPNGPVFLPVICYEMLFDDMLNAAIDLAKKKYPGREIVIYNPTNDSWFGKTVEPFMHARLARWQAARVSLPFLRATNTGVSMVVAPWGEVLAEGPLFGERVIYADLPVKKAQRRTRQD